MRSKTKTRTFRPAGLPRLGLEILEGRDVPSVAPVLSLSAISDSEIDVNWTNTGAAGYDIVEWVNNQWNQVGFYGPDTTGTAITGLAPGSTHTYDLVTYDPTSDQPWTWGDPQTATTLNQNPTPSPGTIDHPAIRSGLQYSVVNLPLFGANGPVCTDVNQGAVGDCWFLSSLAEVAARNPAAIKSMFTDLGSANEGGVTVEMYKVRFYNASGTAQFVTVDNELPNGGDEYDHPNGCLWVTLAEKAYAQANGAGFVQTQHMGSDSYDALDGGDPAWALHALTGLSTSSFAFNPSDVAGAWNAGKYIVLGTSQSPPDSHIVGDHAYALVGYNPANSQPFTVFNPWGSDTSGFVPGDQERYGLFNATGTFLSQNFNDESFTGAKHNTFEI